MRLKSPLLSACQQYMGSFLLSLLVEIVLFVWPGKLWFGDTFMFPVSSLGFETNVFFFSSMMALSLSSLVFTVLSSPLSLIWVIAGRINSPSFSQTCVRWQTPQEVCSWVTPVYPIKWGWISQNSNVLIAECGQRSPANQLSKFGHGNQLRGGDWHGVSLNMTGVVLKGSQTPRALCSFMVVRKQGCRRYLLIYLKYSGTQIGESMMPPGSFLIVLFGWCVCACVRACWSCTHLCTEDMQNIHISWISQRINSVTMSSAILPIYFQFISDRTRL